MSTAPAPFVKESLNKMSATVEKISMDTREVTLRGKDGKEQTIQVGPEARNLDQVKVGDKVSVSYYEGFTAQMRLHDKPNEGFQTAAGAVKAAPGERPGGAAAQSVSGTVTIDSIDLPGSKVTFHRPDGVAVTIPIRTDAGRKFVGTLKKGDVVDVMYTEAVAVDVTEAKDKSK
jgi:Cu/Ag efflux protein CusF